MTRRLRMPYLRSAAVDVVPTARAQRWDPAELLRALLAEEITGRDQATLRMRRRQANFPAGKTFAVWDEQRCSIPVPTQQALRTLEWVDRHENLSVCGPSGTGKTICAEAISCKTRNGLSAGAGRPARTPVMPGPRAPRADGSASNLRVPS